MEDLIKFDDEEEWDKQVPSEKPQKMQRETEI